MRFNRFLILAATVVIATGASLSSASAVLSKGIPCRPGHSKLLAADAQAIVYLGRVPATRTEPAFPAYLGCVRGGRHAYEVGEPGYGSSSGAVGTRNLTVTSSVVAWEESESTTGVLGEPDEEEWIVLVRDLRTGRILHKLPTGNSTAKQFTGAGPTTQIVVKGNGSVAWIVETRFSTGPRPAQYEVHIADGSGTRTLAAGSNISPNSLALAGNTLYWTQGGAAMSATLPL